MLYTIKFLSLILNYYNIISDINIVILDNNREIYSVAPSYKQREPTSI